jgi:hypothetical protein
VTRCSIWQTTAAFCLSGCSWVCSGLLLQLKLTGRAAAPLTSSMLHSTLAPTSYVLTIQTSEPTHGVLHLGTAASHDIGRELRAEKTLHNNPTQLPLAAAANTALQHTHTTPCMQPLSCSSSRLSTEPYPKRGTRACTAAHRRSSNRRPLGTPLPNPLPRPLPVPLPKPLLRPLPKPLPKPLPVPLCAGAGAGAALAGAGAGAGSGLGAGAGAGAGSGAGAAFAGAGAGSALGAGAGAGSALGAGAGAGSALGAGAGAGSALGAGAGAGAGLGALPVSTEYPYSESNVLPGSPESTASKEGMCVGSANGLHTHAHTDRQAGTRQQGEGSIRCRLVGGFLAAFPALASFLYLALPANGRQSLQEQHTSFLSPATRCVCDCVWRATHTSAAAAADTALLLGALADCCLARLTHLMCGSCLLMVSKRALK